MALDKVTVNDCGMAGHQWYRYCPFFFKFENIRILDGGNAKTVRAHVIGPFIAAAASRILVHDYLSPIVRLRSIIFIVGDCVTNAGQQEAGGNRHSKMLDIQFYSPTAWNSNMASRIGVIGSP